MRTDGRSIGEVVNEKFCKRFEFIFDDPIFAIVVKIYKTVKKCLLFFFYRHDFKNSANDRVL